MPTRRVVSNELVSLSNWFRRRMTPKPDILKIFHEQVAEGGCIPFVGAGFSTNADANPPPLYDDFATLLTTQYFASDQNDDGAVAGTTFEQLANEPGEDWLKERICRTIRDATPGEVHRLFVQLPWPLIITTNWDCLLERACSEIEKPYRICAAERDYWTVRGLGQREGELQIIKLHGDCDHMSDMVVRPSSMEYERFKAVHPRLMQILASVLTMWTPVFIGYSLRDPHIKFLRQVLQVNYAASTGTRPGRHYIVLLDPNEDDIEDDIKDAEAHNLAVVPLVSGKGEIEPKKEGWRMFLKDLQRSSESRQKVSQSYDVSRLSIRTIYPAADTSEAALDCDRKGTNACPIQETAHLPEVAKKLQSKRWPVLVLWTHQEMLDKWLAWFLHAAAEVSISIVLISYQQITQPLPDGVRAIMGSLKEANVIALLMDFTDRNSAMLAYHSHGSTIPLVALIQQGHHLPVSIHGAKATCRYAPTALESGEVAGDTALLRTIVVQLALRAPLAGCDELIANDNTSAAVLQSWICLETALWHLVDRICRNEGIKQRPQGDTIWNAAKFLKKHASKYMLYLDTNAINKYNNLRNSVVHSRGIPPKLPPRDLAEEMVEFVNEFIRKNIGPNLVGFERR